MANEIKEAFLKFFSPKEEVIGHWYVPVDNFQFVTADFYQMIEKELTVRKVPGLEISRVEFSEGGMLLGIERKTIVEFSFLLAVPTMLAATGFDLIKNYKDFSDAQFNTLGIGFFVSFIMAVISIKLLLHFIKKNSFTMFGIYRILLVFLFIFLFF